MAERCQGKRRDGSPCTGPAVAGGEFCQHHRDTDEVVQFQRGCQGRKSDGETCGNYASRGEVFCQHHLNGGRHRAKTLPPFQADNDPLGDLPAGLHDRMSLIQQEHGDAFPECEGGALVAEECEHGGTVWICWGCREVVAGFGFAQDSCLDAFRIRGANRLTNQLLCSAVLLPGAAVGRQRRTA